MVKRGFMRLIDDTPKIHPVKFGLALSAAGQSLMGVGGISSISGAKGDLVTYTMLTGFFFGAAGVFITTLFTDGNGKYNPHTKNNATDKITHHDTIQSGNL